MALRLVGRLPKRLPCFRNSNGPALGGAGFNGDNVALLLTAYITRTFATHVDIMWTFSHILGHICGHNVPHQAYLFP